MGNDIQEYYQCILDNLTGGLISVDLKGEVAYINPMAGRILHLPEEASFRGLHYGNAFEDFPAIKGVIRETLETGKCVRRAEISITHAGTPLIIGYSTMPVRTHDGEQLGITVIFQDISFAGKK